MAVSQSWSATGSQIRSYVGTLSVTETSVDRDSNSSTLTWSLILENNNTYYYRAWSTTVSVTIDGVEVAPSNKVTVYMAPNGPATYHSYTFWSGQTTVVSHNADGTKSVACAAKITRMQTTDASYLPGVIDITGGILQLTDIPKTSRINIHGQGSDNQTFLLRTNDYTYDLDILKENPTDRDTISYSVLGHTGTLVTNSLATSTTITIPSAWLNDIPNADETTIEFDVETVHEDGTSDRGVLSRPLMLSPDIVPSMSSLEAEPDPSTMNAYATGKTATKLRMSATPSVGAGVVIKSFKITGAESGESEASNNAGTFSSQMFSTSGIKTFNVVAVDSRGRQSEAMSVSVTYIVYELPVITTMTCERGIVEDGEFTPVISGAAIRVTLEATVSLTGNSGVFTVTCVGSETYTRYLSALSGSVVFDATSDLETYTITAAFRDSFNGETTRDDTVAKVSVPLNINTDPDNPSVGIGGINTSSKSVKFFSPWKFYLPEFTDDVATVLNNASGGGGKIVKAIFSGTCSTAAATRGKTVSTDASLTTSTLTDGTLIAVYFTYGNTASSPTLNVNSTGSKTIVGDTKWKDGEAKIFFYKNGQWNTVDGEIDKVISYLDISNKPTINGTTVSGDLTSSDLGLAAAGDIPTKLSDLSDDSTHRVVTDAEKSTWNAKSDFSGNYSDLIGVRTADFKITDGGITTTYKLLVVSDS